MKIIIKLAVISLICFLIACSNPKESSSELQLSGLESAGGDPGEQTWDPPDLYDAPTEITTVTLPRETQMRFSYGGNVAGSLTNKDKADLRVSTTSAGWYFLSFAEYLQGGTQDLGAIDEEIDQIDPPESGYILAERVMALEGHTYAVKGRDDEAGHFIIVRVTGFGVDSTGTPTITLDYFYR